jgi:hypothetical protein
MLRIHPSSFNMFTNGTHFEVITVLSEFESYIHLFTLCLVKLKMRPRSRFIVLSVIIDRLRLTLRTKVTLWNN